MSKFTDELDRSFRSATPSIGFRKDTGATKKPPLLLVADLTGKTLKDARVIIEAGIDAVIVKSSGLKPEAVQKLLKNIGDVPSGIIMDDSRGENIEYLDKSCDFVIFSSRIPVSFITGDGPGIILSVEPGLSPGIIRAINDLNLTVNGIYINSEDTTVTIERLLVCNYISGILGKPLLLSVSAPLTTIELQGLYDAGVRGLLLPKELSIKMLKELKKLIDDMPRTAGKKSKSNVLLPQITSSTEVEPEEEEEDI